MDCAGGVRRSELHANISTVNWPPTTPKPKAIKQTIRQTGRVKTNLLAEWDS
jgi:hypothetical protein